MLLDIASETEIPRKALANMPLTFFVEFLNNTCILQSIILLTLRNMKSISRSQRRLSSLKSLYFCKISFSFSCTSALNLAFLLSIYETIALSITPLIELPGIYTRPSTPRICGMISFKEFLSPCL